MRIKNAFSIDTEDWYHANFQEGLFTNDGSMKSTVEENVDRYLQIFAENNVKATFFVLGTVVEQHKTMVQKIANQGHEIASHGYGHQLVYKQTPKEFREDVYKSKCLLEDAVGYKIEGYRAPSWSITERSLWALDILEELGFSYNSGIFPTKNFLYGIPYAPRFIHSCDVYNKPNLKMVCIPPATLRLPFMNIPFGGGAYFRFLPYPFISLFTDVVNKIEKKPVVFYLHPREIDPSQPRLDLNWKEAYIHYCGINGCEKKLCKILKKSEFITLREYVKTLL